MPACSTCKTKRHINHAYSYPVGRRVHMIDLISSTYSSSRFECVQRVIAKVADFDKYGWQTLLLSNDVCAKGADDLPGLVDAMTVDKVLGGSSYDWVAAKETLEPGGWRALNASVLEPSPELSEGIALQLAKASRPGESAIQMAQGRMAAHAQALRPPELGEGAHESRPAPAQLVDVVMIEPPADQSRTRGEISALMHAVRYRLASHAAFAGATVVVESNVTGQSRKPLQTLSASPEWLTAEERQRHNVSHLVLPAARVEMFIRMAGVGFASENLTRPVLWAGMMSHLERSLPNRFVFASAPDEILDADQLLAWIRSDIPPNYTPATTTKAGAQHSTLVRGASPLQPWLSGNCAIPRLRGLRYGGPHCALPPRMRSGGDHLHGWARTAVFFTTHGDWDSRRGRRSAVLLAEPPPTDHVNPYMNGHLGNMAPVPPKLSWGLACPSVPLLQSPCEATRRCAPENPEKRLCESSFSCAAQQLREHGREMRHLGWRFVDALLPLTEMTHVLKRTTTAAAAAREDHVAIFSPRNSEGIYRAYAKVVEKRREISQATDAHVHAALGALIRNCTDYRWLGLNEPLDEEHVSMLRRQALEQPSEGADFYYGRAPWADGDEDARRLPSKGGWPRQHHQGPLHAAEPGEH